jgi:subfamily B ATP-binding cassette protein HlyB/CyaB
MPNATIALTRPAPRPAQKDDPTASKLPDAGVGALVLIARHHQIAADPDQIRHAAGLAGTLLSSDELALAARRLGLKTRLVTTSAGRIARIPCPALGLGGDGAHFILVGADSEKAMLLNPYGTAPTTVPVAEAITRCEGRFMVFASRASLAGELARFDFSWFIPAIVKYRRLLFEVVIVSFVLQLFGLVTPLMFQVVMDKVLVNRAFNTLTVVCVALLACSLFEVLLTGLRNYVFSHTTNRIDVELGSRLYRHLMSLPIKYFAARRVGDSVARVRELESIRNFLTGQAVTAVLDLFFSFVFLAVMFAYSGWLTLIVVVSLPMYAAISAVLNPILRRRLNEKFARGADNQSFLVESVSAAETVKAMAVEPQFTRRWDTQLAAYVSAGFRVGNVGNLGQQLIQLVGKFVNLAILYYGAVLVIDGKLSVGQLIAFNMMAQRVAAPVLRLAQLWQDFQQVGISMLRLGDILNARNEQPQSRQVLPTMQGHIAFENVSFRYREGSPLVLDGVSLTVQAGQVIGIVGRSGSGKSTLTKLVQRMYLAESGRVRVDGIDLALADPAWLRRNIGVVLQDNVLFNRSVRENIALADPGVPLTAVIQAAVLAGAHEFICELPEGYDTLITEHGANLSGGQRQRVAIARALITNPSLTVLEV